MKRWAGRLREAFWDIGWRKKDPVASVIVMLACLAFGLVVGWFTVGLIPTGTVGEIAFWVLLLLGTAGTAYAARRRARRRPAR